MNDELLQRERVIMAVMARPRATAASIDDLVKEADTAMNFIRQPVTPAPSNQIGKAA